MRRTLPGVALALVAAPAMAHPGHGAAAGLAHVGHADHLPAMLALGLGAGVAMVCLASGRSKSRLVLGGLDAGRSTGAGG